MKSKTKAWLFTSAVFIILGIIIFISVITINDFDFSKLSTVKYETKTHNITQEFNNITINTDTADIAFIPSDSQKCKVLCIEEKNIRYSVSVQNDTLVINTIDSRKWYEYIGIATKNPKIEIYLPITEYGSLYIKDGTGNIDINDISATELELSTSTGDISLSDISCKNNVTVKASTGQVTLNNLNCNSLISNGSTGDITLNNVIAKDNFSISRSTGNIKLQKSDANQLHLKTDTGYVKGSLLSEKIFLATSSTGNIRLPKTVSGGKCEIITNTGDINISIK